MGRDWEGEGEGDVLPECHAAGGGFDSVGREVRRAERVGDGGFAWGTLALCFWGRGRVYGC